MDFSSSDRQSFLTQLEVHVARGGFGSCQPLLTEHRAVGVRRGGSVLAPEAHGEALDGSEHEICLESDLWIVHLAVANL